MAWPIRHILRNQKNATVLMAEVRAIDTSMRQVETYYRRHCDRVGSAWNSDTATAAKQMGHLFDAASVGCAESARPWSLANCHRRHHLRRMCGRYASFLPAEALARVFGTTGALPNLEPTWNMAPTKDAPIVRFHTETSERRLEVAKWGLVPFFTKDLAKARKPINARCETVARSPLFKEAFARRRCLVPAGAYYEWRHDPSGKTPFAIARRDGEPVALGGMWEE
jgi:hypothetical protein